MDSLFSLAAASLPGSLKDFRLNRDVHRSWRDLDFLDAGDASYAGLACKRLSSASRKKYWDRLLFDLNYVKSAYDAKIWFL